MQAEDEQIVEDDGPSSVNKLTEKGVAAADIKKLIDAGFRTIESILFTPKKNLILVKGLSEAKIDKILEAANSIINLGFMSAKAFFEKRKN